MHRGKRVWESKTRDTYIITEYCGWIVNGKPCNQIRARLAVQRKNAWVPQKWTEWMDSGKMKPPHIREDT